jgi:hypothetical protein
MATIGANHVAGTLEKLQRKIVIASRPSALPIAALLAAAMLAPLRTQAQWWSRAPADFEECADAAEKAATKDAKASALTACNAKFAGRRKPGGGYTYYDFMQNRSFDIAGPNPTPEEQKQIDEQYTAFLDRERRNSIAAALAAKQQQQLLQQASLQSEKVPENEKPPAPVETHNKPQAVVNDIKPHPKNSTCAPHTFSCDWPRLSESIKDLKKALFGSPTSKAKRS